MPRGRPTTLTPTLSPEEQHMLTHWAHATTVPAGMARRARLILLLAAGHTITEVAARVGLSRRHTYKWIYRWQQQRLAGLRDEPRGYRAHRRHWHVPQP